MDCFNHRNTFSLLLFLTLTHCSTFLYSAPGLEQFIKLPKYEAVQISPDGEKLAVIVLEEGKRVLALMTLDPMAFTYVLRFSQNDQVGDFFWVNEERVVVSVWRKWGWYDSPSNYGQLYAINYNGRKGKTIFGVDLLVDNKEAAHGTVISLLEDDRKHVLISTHPWSRLPAGWGARYAYRGEKFGEVLKLNVYNGRTRKVVKHPAKGGRAFADRSGVIHFALGQNDAHETVFYQRRGENWELLAEGTDYPDYPVGYSEDGKYAFLASNRDMDTRGLVKFDLVNGSRETLFQDPRVDIAAYEYYPGTQEPMLVGLENGMPGYHFFDEAHPSSKFFRGAIKAFKGQQVSLQSVTPDGRLAVLEVFADNLPPDYYLADLEKKTLAFLLSSADWLEPKNLARAEVIELEARDGTPLQGYLTFPAGERKGLPMVVMPHGGPASRDYWGYNRDAQILAANGYLVLQVNFRGSTGYGIAFREASDRQWGKAVQDDITDAALWVVEQGYADGERLCIYGVSFGAYSALMSAIREPDLYRCAAGYAGIYDLQLLYSEGDIRQRDAGVAYLKEAVGEDEEELAAQSPVARADELRIPIFIAHGGEDYRAPIEHAEALIAAAKRNKLDYTAHINKAGGHGFYTEESNRALYQDLLAFFHKHLGSE